MRALLAAALAALLAVPAAAQARRNLLETLESALAGDPGYDPAERAALLAAVRARFADYGLQIVTPERAKGVPVVLHVLVEGSFDEAPPERAADVAFAAWQATSRGADPEVVEGIALYGYRKKISADTLAAWANGYRQLTANRVPDAVAADLVRLSMERGLADSDFNALKWALVDGVKNGFDARDYATFLFGRMLEGKSGPGRVAADAKAAFTAARRAHGKVALPPYEGVFAKALPPAPSYEPPAAPAAPPPAPEPAKPAPSAPKASPSSPKAPSAPKTAPAAPPTPAAPPARTAESKPAAPPPALPELWPGLDRSARSYLGTPYVWGGTTHQGIDCSALTQNSYAENRVKIPRVSRDQWKTGSKTEALREGDLIFFNTMGAGVSHVGMVVDAKAGKFIHASSSHGVMIAELGKKYYQQRYLGARRVVP